MSDPVTFLNARLDEDEAAAKRALEMGTGVWALAPHFHTARHSPDRVLREVTAKRVIVDEHEHRFEMAEHPEYGFGCDLCHRHDEYGMPPGVNWCGTIRALAAVYSDHADYRDEWALGEAVHSP
jgi:uncharacterized protein DUF6221